MNIAAGIAALFLALIHFWADKIHFSKIPRSKWLSFAGGVSVAFIFVHVLPELKEWQEGFAQDSTSGVVPFIDHHLYLVALLGLAVFYGLERQARISAESKREAEVDEDKDTTGIFWVHILSFAVYNFLIGYLLVHREDNTTYSLIIFTTAMAFHFVVNDFGLLDHYERSYQKRGRWIIALSVIFGWLLGAFTEVPDAYIGIMYAFVAGAVIMNVLKEELPEERKSKFLFFLLGIIAYSIILLSI